MRIKMSVPWCVASNSSHQVRHSFCEEIKSKRESECDRFVSALMTGLSWRETETNITSVLPQTCSTSQSSVSSPSLHRSVLGEIPFYYCPSLQQTVVVSVGPYDDVFAGFNNGKIPLLWTHAWTVRLKAQLCEGFQGNVKNEKLLPLSGLMYQEVSKIVWSLIELKRKVGK